MTTHVNLRLAGSTEFISGNANGKREVGKCQEENGQTTNKSGSKIETKGKQGGSVQEEKRRRPGLWPGR